MVDGANPKDTNASPLAVQSIEELPEHESPELFGMHPNVDLTFRKLQVQEAIQVILDTQPQGPTSNGSGSIEDTVDGICLELLTKARPSSHHGMIRCIVTWH